jgi:hypothetical protein
MLVNMGDSEVLEEPRLLCFNQSKEVVTMIKQGGVYYVEATPENEKLLKNSGHGYVRGTLELNDKMLRFNPKIYGYVQLHVGDLTVIDIDDSEVNMEFEVFNANLDESLSKLAKIVSERFSTEQLQVAAFVENVEFRTSKFFDFYQRGIREVRKVHLIHSVHGLCRLVTRQETGSNNIALKLEPVCNVFYLEDGKS